LAILLCATVGTGIAHADPKPEGESPPDQSAAADEAGASVTARADGLGALGAYWDERNEIYVVAVPSDGPNLTADDFSDLAPTIVKRLPISAKRIDKIGAALRSVAQNRDSDGHGYDFFTDLRSGKVVLTSSAPESVFADALREYGDDIEYRRVESGFTRSARINDGEPHWGGAQLDYDGQVGGLPECTSGLTVRKTSNSTKYMVTAGHCFFLNETVYGGTGLDWGDIDFLASFPAKDMELIGGTSYAGRIFTGGATGVATAIVNAGDPIVGYGYCAAVPGPTRAVTMKFRR